jgi:large repetitive protein
MATRHLLYASVLTLLLMLGVPGRAAAAAPTGDFSASPQVQTIGAPVGVTSENVTDPDGTAVGVAWSFGDGSSSGGASAQHAYATRGTKTITMTLTDGNGETASVQHTVRINAPPVAAFTWAPSVPQIDQAVGFDGGSSSDAEGAVSFLWDLGDGSASTQASPQHAYHTAGNKTVTLRVTDSDGVATVVQHTVRVNAPPTARFTFAALDRVAGQPFNVPLLGQRVAFDGGSSSDPDGPQTIAKYEWDFNGDGVFGDAPNSRSLIAVLTTPGVVNIGVRVTDADGATAVSTQPVRVDQVPQASFVFTPTSPLAGQRVDFGSTSTDPDGAGDITSLLWDLNGDGTYGDAAGPTATRVFAIAGMYSIGLAAIDTVGVQSFSQQTLSIAIPGTPPKAGTPFQVAVTSNPPSGGPSTTSAASSGGPRTRFGVIGGIRVAIAGRVFTDVTRITRLVVTAPSGALVTARCKGQGCPPKSERHRAGPRGSVRMRKLERSFGPGTRIAVVVTKSGFIGKEILFTIRRGQPPVRRELCVVPGARRATRCPSS